MKLEVRVPISPEPHFFRQVEYLWRSFVAGGGLTATARFSVWVGGDCEPYDIAERYAWSRGNVAWHWVDRERFRRESYYATGVERFTHETDADVVLLSDADTLLIKNVDEIFEALVAQPAVAGVIAHVPPFERDQNEVNWERVFESVGRRLPPDRYEHTGWGGMFAQLAHRFCPAYFNYGAVFVPGHLFTTLGREYERQIAVAERAASQSFFKPQVALAFAIDELNAPRLALPPRYNFPNDDWADRKFALDDLPDVRIIHYLREGVIGTRRDTWGNDASFTAFLDRTDLSGSNEVLRRTVAALYASQSSKNAANPPSSIS